MATEHLNVTIGRMSTCEITVTVCGSNRMLLIGDLFATLGYPIMLGALCLEVT